MPLADPFHPLPADLGIKKVSFGQLYGASQGLMLSYLAEDAARPLLIITPDILTAERIQFELNFFQPHLQVIYFPDWETLPYDQFSPHQDIISERLSALSRIPHLPKRSVLITPITTLMHRLPPLEFLSGNVFYLKVGSSFHPQTERARLEKAGYRSVELVREHGEFAIRGAVIDIFPMGSDLPFRLELFGDEIETIKTFSVDNQRSIDLVNKIELLPAKEFSLNENSIELFRKKWRSQFAGNPLNASMYNEISEGIYSPGIEYYLPFFYEQMSTLFEYLPSETLVITLDDTHQKADDFWQEIQNRYEQRAHDLTRPILKPPQIFIAVNEIFSHIHKFTHIKVQPPELAAHATHFNFATAPPPTFSIDYKASRPLAELEDFTKTYTGRILFCAETTGRREVLLDLLNTIALTPTLFSSWQAFLSDTAMLGMIVAPLDEGLSLTNPQINLIAETQLFGKKVMQRRRRKEPVQNLESIVKDLTELKIGAPIVHIDHGVGRYLGLETLQVGSQVTEFLKLEYAGGDKLYVPVASLHLINRYSGQDPENAPLHKLGTENFRRAKRKAAEKLRDVASELLEIYAKRAVIKSQIYQEINDQYAAFAAAFPFEETEDQLKAINAVMDDMLSSKPMDRLICGDVGFGKTEVAMRAAFFAALNGKQVAMLVPTTLLVHQHFQTFQDRFSDWPIKISAISRFKGNKEIKQTFQDIKEGKVDIVIGTHKLLQNKIYFKSLGLLIIDEEHRFGVHQKEHLKKLSLNVDILTLTATPIPRTLNMAFAGIRDLSIIATPPARRLSVKTFLYEYQTAIIKEGILREIMRGGQVYFLHNEVASIERMAKDLEKLIPEAKIGIAHGQMRERELEQVMADFYHRRFNVLVCSTIIESGIDIPSANTMIINRADKFGLAELHQLRGRVGRSHHQAYTYLLVPSLKNLKKEASQRLEAITQHEDLGVGFTLATHDLEIRGAGELLGKDQSGQMHEIGFTLYMDLLSRTIDAFKNGKELDLDNITQPGVEIDLQIPALIPENYLSDVHLRLQCYKRIASAKTDVELDEIQVEMIDRFGLLPPVSKNLFLISALQQKAEKLGIIKIEANNKGGKIEFNDKPLVDPTKIIKLIQNESAYFKLEGPTRLRFFWEEHPIQNRVALVEAILKKLI